MFKLTTNPIHDIVGDPGPSSLLALVCSTLSDIRWAEVLAVVCQLILGWTKTQTDAINISDCSTKLVPPSADTQHYEIRLVPTPRLTKLVYLTMLFILGLISIVDIDCYR